MFLCGQLLFVLTVRTDSMWHTIVLVCEYSSMFDVWDSGRRVDPLLTVPPRKNCYVRLSITFDAPIFGNEAFLYSGTLALEKGLPSLQLAPQILVTYIGSSRWSCVEFCAYRLISSQEIPLYVWWQLWNSKRTAKHNYVLCPKDEDKITEGK